MKYEDTFTDFEKMKYEAGWQGYKYKNFGPMYEYLMKKQGDINANFFLQEFTKRQKRVFCARVVYLNHPIKENALKAEKYYNKHKGEIL